MKISGAICAIGATCRPFRDIQKRSFILIVNIDRSNDIQMGREVLHVATRITPSLQASATTRLDDVSCNELAALPQCVRPNASDRRVKRQSDPRRDILLVLVRLSLNLTAKELLMMMRMRRRHLGGDTPTRALLPFCGGSRTKTSLTVIYAVIALQAGCVFFCLGDFL
jgi:hypothetical protein